MRNMKRANLRYIAPITISLLIPFGLFAATQFVGPTQSPTGGNTPGVIWDMSAGGSQSATINISGPATINGATNLNGTISAAGTVVTDINLSDTRALRVDKNGTASYNMGNWYGGSSKPFTLGLYGDLVMHGFGGATGQRGRVDALEYCINGGSCISAWPSGGGGITSIANGGGLTVTNPSGPATTLSVIDNYVNTTGDTMSGVLTMNGSFASYQPLVEAINGGVNGYGLRGRGYSGGVLGYANNSSGFGVFGSNPVGYYGYLGTGSFSVYGYGPAYLYNNLRVRDKVTIGLDSSETIILDPGLASGIADVQVNGNVSVLNNRNICLGGVCRNSWPAAGGAPGGANGNVQFNNSGSFGGDNGLFWDNTNKRLGLGTTAPANRLQVSGNIRADNSAQYNNVISAYNNANYSFAGYFESTGNGAYGINAKSNTACAGVFDLMTGGNQVLAGCGSTAGALSVSVQDSSLSTRYAFATNGNVYLGGGAAGGSAANTGNLYLPTTGGIGFDGNRDNTAFLQLWSDGNFYWDMGTAGNFYLRASGGATRFRLNATDGNAYKSSGAGSWLAYSDKRLKDVKSSYAYGLDQISLINPIVYQYKKDNKLGLITNTDYVGVVAQDLQKVIPEAVEKSDNGYLTVNNDYVIWASVNAIKELKAENDDLKARIERLEAKLGN